MIRRGGGVANDNAMERRRRESKKGMTVKQVFDEEIYDIVEKGLLGGGLTKTETLKLYQVPETSK